MLILFSVCSFRSHSTIFINKFFQDLVLWWTIRRVLRKSMKANWKLFLPCLLPSKLLVFRCESEEKTFHDKPPKLISMKGGIFSQVSFRSVYEYPQSTDTRAACFISSEKTNQWQLGKSFGEQFFNVSHVCCKSHKAIVFKGTFHFVLRALDSYPISGKQHKKAAPNF